LEDRFSTKEAGMPDESESGGAQHRDQISIDEDHERRFWSEELGVNEKALTGAVMAVGRSFVEVKEYLQMQGG
jgi:hypothetical protein